ncbi:GGDEF domain-containing protein [Reinekea sp. G2M2-21]|uniref:GGDEF domain-containing protein n=1 Tax=Reinekea sp. G2M2-21 TaxID=2788942 RepID=UPI0018AC1618|nr:GGDEF domain-containing protein [Reinekea sp. G2M2-21]
MSRFDRRQKSRLRNIVIFLLGDDSDPLRQTKMLFALTATAFLSVSLLFNLISGVTAAPLNWVFSLLLPFNVWLWFLGRWRNKVNVTTNGILLSLSYIVLPSTWFFNAGSNGPSLIIFTIALTYSVGVYRAQDSILKLAMVGFVVMPVVLMVMEISYPDWIYPYGTRRDRLIDLFVTYAMCSVSLGVLLMGHTRRFIQELKRANSLADELRRNAEQDSLTKLLNHRTVLAQVERLRSTSNEFTLMLIDVDHFKQINDLYGHQEGDKVLVLLADLMTQHSEQISGYVGRLGGEEFLVVAEGNSIQMQTMDEELRKSLAAQTEVALKVTYSAGIAQWERPQSLDQVIRRADEAMYLAKAEGRDRTVVG